MLQGKVTASQGFLNTGFYSLCRFRELMDFNSATTAMDFSRDAFLLSWAWIALSIFAAFRDIFHSTHRHSGQIHLNEGFLHAAFPAAVTLDDGSLEGDALVTGHVERDIPGGGGRFRS